MTRTVLLTGFGAFDGQALNASWLGVRRAAEIWDGPDVLATAQLPVSFSEVGPALERAVAEHRPDVIVCAGLAEGRSRIGVERAALNVLDARIPDASGWAPVDEPVVAGGPMAYLSRLPIKACVAALDAHDIPAEVSNTAGTYVCNAVFYRLLHALRHDAVVRGGFVHVPQAVETARSAVPTLPLETIAAGLVIIARTSLAVREDLRVTGGAVH
ncbi:pyroglutamyl-peptidase I [Actinotalea sp.]|uniref:pyroglutamyl-peptidase I n=1 Tax=Actinotalea sp. TaxID=1872145 RepID=UPI0035688307